MNKNKVIKLAKQFNAIAVQFGAQDETLPLKNLEESIYYESLKDTGDFLSGYPLINQVKYWEAQLYYGWYMRRFFPLMMITFNRGLSNYYKYMEETIIIGQEAWAARLRLSLNQSIAFLRKKQKKINLRSTNDLFLCLDRQTLKPLVHLWVVDGKIGEPYLAISKGYQAFYQGLKPALKKDVPSPYQLKGMRWAIMMHKDLIKFCHENIPAEECNLGLCGGIKNGK